MVSKNAAPKELTLHAIKKLCESSNLSAEFSDVKMAVQCTDVNIFEAERKNIRARIALSDGVSRMVCMVPHKIFDQMVSASDKFAARVKV